MGSPPKRGQSRTPKRRRAPTSPSVAAALRAQDAVLLEQVVDDRLLLAVDPAREQKEEEGERGRRGVHESPASTGNANTSRLAGNRDGDPGWTSRARAVELSARLSGNSAEFSHRTGGAGE